MSSARITELRNKNVHQEPVETRRFLSAVYELPVDFNMDQIKQLLNTPMSVKVSAADQEGNQTASVVIGSGETLVGAISDHRITDSTPDSDDLYSLCKDYLEIMIAVYNEWLVVRGHKTKE